VGRRKIGDPIILWSGRKGVTMRVAFFEATKGCGWQIVCQRNTSTLKRNTKMFALSAAVDLKRGDT